MNLFKDTWKQPEGSAAACEKEREEEVQQTGNSVVGAKRRHTRKGSSRRYASVINVRLRRAGFDLQEHLYANNANRIDFYAPEWLMNINTLWCSWGLNKLLMSFSSLLLHFDFPPLFSNYFHSPPPPPSPPPTPAPPSHLTHLSVCQLLAPSSPVRPRRM